MTGLDDLEYRVAGVDEVDKDGKPKVGIADDGVPVFAEPMLDGEAGFAQAFAEYERALPHLETPKGAELTGITWPDAQQDAQGNWFYDRYEPGVGLGAAQEEANCLWIGEWIKQRGQDSQREAAALTKLEEYTKTRTFNEFYDPGSTQILYLENLEKAKLGDPSGFAVDLKHNCRQ